MPRLYQRIEQYDRAVDALVRHAALEGDKGATHFAEAGRIALENMNDPDAAQKPLAPRTRGLKAGRPRGSAGLARTVLSAPPATLEGPTDAEVRARSHLDIF